MLGGRGRRPRPFDPSNFRRSAAENRDSLMESCTCRLSSLSPCNTPFPTPTLYCHVMGMGPLAFALRHCAVIQAPTVHEEKGGIPRETWSQGSQGQTFLVVAPTEILDSRPEGLVPALRVVTHFSFPRREREQETDVTSNSTTEGRM